MIKPVAVTIGNPNGVGPEVCAKAIGKLSAEEQQRLILIGDRETFHHYFKGFDPSGFIQVDGDSPGNFHFRPGEKSLESGRLSYLFIQKAVELAKAGNISSLVTAPISKELIVKSGVEGFMDHTTFLAKEFNSQKYNMLFYSSDIKVILATIHVPLNQVSFSLTTESVYNTISNAADFLRVINSGGSRIAVCGLNPHAGENGLLGSEDEAIIRPAVERFSNKGIQVTGPLPADTVFYKAYHKEFDMVVAMYHDQGLAPFKMLHFNDGVNVTLGLPIVRTSPDHGTAFDIAGKGLADEGSMLCAIRLAFQLLDHKSGPVNL